jgi:hypothetical protein
MTKEEQAMMMQLGPRSKELINIMLDGALMTRRTFKKGFKLCKKEKNKDKQKICKEFL